MKTFHLRPGVLTKADRIDEGDHHPWLTIAANENRAWKLTHGWYVTKQCSTTELSQNLSPEEVLAKERTFFKDTEPWKGLEQNRFGTPKLADALSNLLSQMIRDKYFPIPSSLIVVFLKYTRRFPNSSERFRKPSQISPNHFQTTHN